MSVPTPQTSASRATGGAGGREVIVRFGGAAGDGVSSLGEMFARLCSRQGLHVCTYTSYQSVIRGGHVWFQVRASESKVTTHGHEPDIVVALNAQTADIHFPEVTMRGAAIYDASLASKKGTITAGAADLELPLVDVAKKYEPRGIMRNTVAMSAACGLLDVPFAAVEDILRWNFAHKKDEIVQGNVKAAREGYDSAQQKVGKVDWAPRGTGKPKMLLTGNQAIATGALAAGCKFYAAYPMTPASSILHHLAEVGPKHGMVVKQVEDEIGVVNMTIGAAHAGARAMCGTSGGGFALMTEALGMAGMTETPLVVVESQRGGPSTGLPTKTEQGDLWQMLGASQGEYPKAILAPGTIEDCFESTVEAFNLAEKYQMPVIVASDLVLSEHLETVEALPFEKVSIDRGEWADAKSAVGTNGGNGYQRYAITPSGVSPRAIPGTPRFAYAAGTDEHDEYGHLISDVLSGVPQWVAKRREMMDKRMRKMTESLKTAKPPNRHGPSSAEVTLVGWGGTWGGLVEASDWLTGTGLPTNVVHFRHIWPFDVARATEALRGAKRLVGVEGNHSGQFARLLRGETGIAMHHKVLKFDGEPIYPREIVESVKAFLGKTPLKAEVKR